MTDRPMTEEERAELVALDRAATKGPWRIQMLDNQEGDLISGGTFMGLTGGSGAPDTYEPDDAAEWEANARLIVAMRNALPALLSTSAAVRGMLTRDQVADEIARYAEGLVPETRGVAVWLENHFRAMSPEDVAVLSGIETEQEQARATRSAPISTDTKGTTK